MLRIIASYSHSINKPHAFLQVSFLVLVIVFSPVNFSLLGMRYFMENLRTIAFVDSGLNFNPNSNAYSKTNPNLILTFKNAIEKGTEEYSLFFYSLYRAVFQGIKCLPFCYDPASIG